MPIERREPTGGGENLIEISEEEARVKHGGPLRSRRKTGKLAPEAGQDFVPFEQIPDQKREDPEDIGFSADSQNAIGEDEIIDEIDKKLRQDWINQRRAKQPPQKRRTSDWQNKKISEEEKKKFVVREA